jgi:predicted choloylglycine hydrolase
MLQRRLRWTILFLPLALGTLASVAVTGEPEKEPFRFPEARLANAELKYRNDLPVLVVSGSPEEIGTAVGTLALKPAPRVLDYPRDLLKMVHAEKTWGLFVLFGNGMFRQFPPDYQKELEAMVKAAGADRNALVVGNTLFDLKKIVACSALMVEKERSATGGPLLGRNLDYPSLGYVNQYSLVTVYRPAGKHAFAAIGFPGLVGCLSGMNDAGLSLAVLEVFALHADEKPVFDAEGIPYAQCYRKILEECTTIAEAKKLLEGLHRTTTTNLVLADTKGVAVFEVAPSRVEERGPEKGTLACTNHYCTTPLKREGAANVSLTFDRFDRLEQVRQGGGKLTPDDVRKELDAVNLGDQTLQTMVFEPATLRLHLSIGKVPASQGELKALDLGPLFKGEDGKKGE